MKEFKNILPGLLVACLIAIISIYLSKYFIIGSKTIAIILGVLVSNIFFKSIDIFDKGISFSEKTLLSFAIILLGSQVNIHSLGFIDYKIFLFIILMIVLSIFICLLIGRLVGLSTKVSLLIGIGNGICGSAAIAGASKILDSKKEDIAISIAIINTLGIVSIFMFPIIISLIPVFSDQNIGLLIGTTVQAFGQVTATGFIIGEDVGHYASIIKMIRIALLGPVLIIVSLSMSRISSNRYKNFNILNIPFFIFGFILLLLLSSLNIFPEKIIFIWGYISNFFLTIAMVAIGFTISIKNTFRNSKSIILAASVSFIIQIIVAFAFINFL